MQSGIITLSKITLSINGIIEKKTTDLYNHVICKVGTGIAYKYSKIMRSLIACQTVTHENIKTTSYQHRNESRKLGNAQMSLTCDIFRKYK